MTKARTLESRGNVFTPFTGCAQIYHQRWYVRSPRGKFHLHGLLQRAVRHRFVDKGMCADWAIHDSENDKGQRNLHIHVLLTMRPLTENGEWGAKTKKVYVLDENGERVPLIDKKTGQQKVDKQNRKQWKCQTIESTDWNSQENAKKWRKDLADTINAINEQLGIAVHWEHRSFKEQGI